MPQVTKYKWELFAIKNLNEGEGIEFPLAHPWGLASRLYKTGLAKELGLRVQIRRDRLIVYREPKIRKWKPIKST